MKNSMSVSTLIDMVTRYFSIMREVLKLGMLMQRWIDCSYKWWFSYARQLLCHVI